VLHDGMPRDLIQGQGHENFKLIHLQSLPPYTGSWQMTSNSSTRI